MATKISLGTLVLGDPIGVGGYGEVYKARIEPFERDFAIKLLDPSPFHSDLERARKRFVKEAEILMDLRHPYITPIYGVGEFESRQYILMEYFDGFNLNQARQVAGSPAPTKLLGFIEYVGLALSHAHQRNIVHRDVKPSNLLTRQGDARVVDFGIAQIMDPTGERFTRTGGTPVGDAYAAPELIDNPRLVDPRCDIYSLGACWFWLLTGTTPRGRNWEASLRSVEDMSRSYENVILKTLDQPDKRYQSMDDLVQDVRALRIGTDPNADREGDLDDDAALLLGVIFAHYAPDNEPISVYRLEQELSGQLSRFALGIGLTTLRRMELVANQEVSGWNEESWVGLVVSETGEEWVRRNRSRVAQLVEQIKPPEKPSSDFDDDIPF